MTAIEPRPRFLLQVLLAITLVALPPSVRAERITIKGFINTLSCAEEGTICPIDKLDPHIAAARDFVLQERQMAGEYYFLINLPRETKARYVLEEVQVTGELNPRYNTIVVDEFMARRGGQYKMVWSEAMMQEELRDQAASEPFSRALAPKD